ncbi:MAG: 23S rRNA (guanosine(2251)-2'-O)-methyltransferase RlmB [Clostridia bacterium]|nr:23S rRNA (guanosine(2251)-2'-O)-methyltransferase RlmB [Clostridia bacterium]
MNKNINNNFNNNFVIGRNSVLEALKSDSEINFIMCSGKIPAEISKIASKKRIIIKYCDHKRLDLMFKNLNHQGIIAQISSRKYVEIEDIINIANKKNQKPFILILDKIQDPHNFGAIIRTAECMGVHGIIISKRRSVSITPTVEKCSCGALSYIKICRVDNLNRACEILKKNNIWICGTDSSGQNFEKLNNFFSNPIALIIGSEGNGMSNSIKKNCDVIASINMYGKINSLNASVAAGIFMHKIAEIRNCL